MQTPCLRRLTTLPVLVAFITTITLSGMAPSPAHAADFSVAEIVGLAGGAAALGLLATQIGAIGTVSAALAGAAAGSAALGTFVELFIKDWSTSRKILPIILGALTGAAIGGTLLGMLAAQAPFIGILSAIVIGGITGEQIAEKLTNDDPDRLPPIPTSEYEPPPLDKASTGPLPPIEASAEADDVSLGPLRQQVIEARRAFEQAAASGDQAARVQALLAYRDAEQAYYRARSQAAR